MYCILHLHSEELFSFELSKELNWETTYIVYYKGDYIGLD